MNYSIFCLVTICSIGFVVLVAADETEELYEKVYATTGEAMSVEETLAALTKLSEALGKTPKAKGVRDVLWASHPSEARCTGDIAMGVLNRIIRANFHYVSIAAFLDHYKEEQDNICVSHQA